MQKFQNKNSKKPFLKGREKNRVLEKKNWKKQHTKINVFFLVFRTWAAVRISSKIKKNIFCIILQAALNKSFRISSSSCQESLHQIFLKKTNKHKDYLVRKNHVKMRSRNHKEFWKMKLLMDWDFSFFSVIRYLYFWE